MEFKVFSLLGYVAQRVNITAKGWTAEKLEEALKEGKVAIQEGQVVLNNLEVIGTVEEVYDHSEDSDYEVDED